MDVYTGQRASARSSNCAAGAVTRAMNVERINSRNRVNSGCEEAVASC